MPKKNNSGNGKMQLVVVQPKPSQGRRKRRRGRRKVGQRVPRSVDLSMRNAMLQYAIALRDPFDQRAVGVRLPDSYRYATNTQIFRNRIALTSSSTGALAFTWLPCPFFCLQMLNGTAAGLGTFSANSNCHYMVSPEAVMNAGLGSYRLVAGGFRLLLSDTVTAAKGVYTVAPVPVGYNSCVSHHGLTNYNVTGNVLPTDFMGLPRPNAASEVLPHSRTFNANDLQYRGDFMAVTAPYDTTVKDFRPLVLPQDTPYTTYGTPLYNGQICGDMIIASTLVGGGVTALDSAKILDMTGNVAFVFYGTGIAPSTAALVMETIYHVEYTPAPSEDYAGLFTSTASPVGSTSLLERIYTAVKDNFYLGKAALRVGANLGMLGVQYARENARRRRRAIEVD